MFHKPVFASWQRYLLAVLEKFQVQGSGFQAYCRAQPATRNLQLATFQVLPRSRGGLMKQTGLWVITGPIGPTRPTG